MKSSTLGLGLRHTACGDYRRKQPYASLRQRATQITWPSFSLLFVYCSLLVVSFRFYLWELHVLIFFTVFIFSLSDLKSCSLESDVCRKITNLRPMSSATALHRCVKSVMKFSFRWILGVTDQPLLAVLWVYAIDTGSVPCLTALISTLIFDSVSIP